jgi:hypothetical protein
MCAQAYIRAAERMTRAKRIAQNANRNLTSRTSAEKNG